MMLINWGRVAAVVALLLALTAGVWKIYHTGVVEGRAEVQTKWNLTKAAQLESDMKLETEVRAREQALQTTADDLRKTKDAQITKLNRSLAAALDGLRSRPTRPEPGSVPGDASVGAGCYPAQLYREDAAVVVELAGEADQLRTAIVYCEAQYSAAREAMNGEPTGVKGGMTSAEVK